MEVQEAKFLNVRPPFNWAACSMKVYDALVSDLPAALTGEKSSSMTLFPTDKLKDEMICLFPSYEALKKFLDDK